MVIQLTIDTREKKIFFEPGRREVGGNWLKEDSIQLKNFINKGQIRTFSELSKESDLWVMNGWRYLQLSHFIERLPKPLRSMKELRPFEQLCMKEQTGGVITQIYKILGTEQELEVPPYIIRWEQELGSQCNKTVIDKILRLAHYLAVDIRRTESHYKCLARWYATPDRVSKMDKTKSNTCWRGCSTPGTMAHIWWECPTIKIFWKKILGLIKDITGKEIAEDPWVFLFHGTSELVKSYKSSLVPIMLDVAKRQIASNWLITSSPCTRDWLLSLNEVYSVEGMDKGGAEPEEEDHLGKWAVWIKFKRTWSYLEEIINLA